MTLTSKENPNQQEIKEPSLFESEPKLKKKGINLSVVLLLVAVIGYWFFHGANIETTGRIKAERFVKLGPLVPGILKEITVKKGDFVQQGMVIAKLENLELVKEVKSKMLEIEKLAHEKSALEKKQEYSEKDFSRLKILYENKVISRSAIESSETELIQSKEAVNAKQNEIELAQLALELFKERASMTDLKAPFSGVVINVNSEMNGNYLKEGEEILGLAEISSFYLEAGILEQAAFQFKPGDKVRVRFMAYPSQVYSGEIKSMEPAIHEEAEKVFKIKRLVACHIHLDSLPPEVRYGMQARVIMEPHWPSLIPGRS